MGPRVAWSSDSQRPVDLNWSFPYSLGSRGHLFYPLFFFSLDSDFRPYFLPPTPSLPHFRTSVEAKRHCSSLQALQPKEVENLYTSDFSVFIREEAVLREIKMPCWSFFWYRFSYYFILRDTLDPGTVLAPMILFSSTPTHPTSETDNMVQEEAKELTPGTYGTGCVVRAFLTPF